MCYLLGLMQAEAFWKKHCGMIKFKCRPQKNRNLAVFPACRNPVGWESKGWMACLGGAWWCKCNKVFLCRQLATSWPLQPSRPERQCITAVRDLGRLHLAGRAARQVIAIVAMVWMMRQSWTQRDSYCLCLDAHVHLLIPKLHLACMGFSFSFPVVLSFEKFYLRNSGSHGVCW
jgi:hypothetical protein